MTSPKPVPLIGRLAIQMKLITMDQLNRATSLQSRSEGEAKKLGALLVELGFINPSQLEKLENVQRSVIAKHRAKLATAATPGQEVAPSPQTASASPRPPSPPAAASTRAPAPSPATDPVSPPVAAEPPLESRTPSLEVPPAAVSPPVPEMTIPAPAVERDELDERAEPAAPAEAVPAPTVASPPAVASGTREAEAVDTPKVSKPVPQLDSPGDDDENSLGLRAASPTAADRERLESFLRMAVEAGSSDIHIHSGAPARIRVNGVLTQAASEVLSVEDTERMVMAVLGESERAELMRYGEIDTCCEIPGVGRFRTNVYRQQRGFDAVLRTISLEPPTLDQLGLPSWIAKYTNYHQGMVLITGPAGCGKSATMAAMVNLINEERQEHILTVEDPIEVVHPSKRCLVNQRHAGHHSVSFARCLRAALREDPDVIVIGELRDLETISLAMTAAETGHFVLATLHTNNSVRTINRMIGAFPSNQQGQVRTMLSESLRAVISQRLVPRADESGRVAAFELLVINKAIANMIRDEKTVQIRSSIQTGSAHGMMLLEQSLDALVKAGTITREAALELAEEKKLISGE